MYQRIVTHGSALDLTGKIFGDLVCLFPVKRTKANRIYWLCKCSCGRKKVVRASHMINGNTMSCGCYQERQSSIRNATHGMSRTSIFCIWASMKARCNNKNAANYHLYGARGIKVCDRWVNSFENFYADMGDRPTNKHSIDRIDNNGNYTPDNCRWATAEQQSNNKSTNKFITYQNLTLTHAQWCRKFDINVGTMHGRINRGWTEIEAITVPAGVTRKDFHSGSYHVEPSTAPTGSVDAS